MPPTNQAVIGIIEAALAAKHILKIKIENGQCDNKQISTFST